MTVRENLQPVVEQTTDSKPDQQLNTSSRLPERLKKFGFPDLQTNFLWTSARILIAASIAGTLVTDFLSRFASEAKADSAVTATIQTWRNRCGVNAHVPNRPEQSIYNTRIVFMFVTTPDQTQNLEQGKVWFNQNVKDRMQVVNAYYSNRMGVNVSYDGAVPTTGSLPNTLEFYRNNTSQFTRDMDTLPMVRSTQSEFIINSRVYASDPSKGLDGAFPPGAWSGNSGVTGVSEMPLALFDPNLSEYDKRLSYLVFLHDLVGHPFFGPFHPSDPQNVLSAVGGDYPVTQIKVSDENLVNTCPPGNPDPVVNPNVKPYIYLPIIISD